MLPTSQNSWASSGMELCENLKIRRKMGALKGLSLLAHTKAQMHLYHAWGTFVPLFHTSGYKRHVST